VLPRRRGIHRHDSGAFACYVTIVDQDHYREEWSVKGDDGWDSGVTESNHTVSNKTERRATLLTSAAAFENSINYY
jgi:hypothetical protein